MSILVPSSLVDVEDSPLSSELWALAYLFLADWKLEASLETAYSTDVVSAETVSESRVGLINRPYRTMAVNLMGLNRDEGLSLKMVASRLAQAANLIPVYVDSSRLLSAADAEDTALACDTTNRRFQADGRIVVAEPTNGDGMFSQFEVAEIESLTDSEITLKAPLSGDFPAGSKVMPLMEARLSLQNSGIYLTADTFEAQFAFIESTGEQTLTPTVAPGTDPAGFPLAEDGIPIMDRRFNWNSDVTGGIQREGGYSQLGRDSVVQAHGERARAVVGFAVTSLNRDDAFELLRFFESRGGRLHPFWILSPMCDYEASEITQTTVTVRAVGPEFDWAFRPHVGITLSNGTIYVAEVSGTTRIGLNDVVTFADPLPSAPLIGDVRSVRMAHRVRFSSDAMREAWITDETVSVSLSVVEVLQEKSVEVEGLLSQPSGLRDLRVEGQRIGGGFVWPARPWDTAQVSSGSPVLKLSAPAITEFVKGGSSDRIGNRVLMRAFGVVVVRGVWAKFYTDYAGSFDLTFRLEREEDDEVLAEVTLDETMLGVAHGTVNKENFAYVQFVAPALITRDRWYRITVEANPWADLHMSQWADRGREEFHAAERASGEWVDVPDDVLALALLLDAGDSSP